MGSPDYGVSGITVLSYLDWGLLNLQIVYAEILFSNRILE